MLRFALLFLLWMLTLGAASIRAEFEDGLVIELKGWARPRDK